MAVAKKKISKEERHERFTQPAEATSITGILPSDDMIAVAKKRIANGEKRDVVLNEMTDICLAAERQLARTYK